MSFSARFRTPAPLSIPVESMYSNLLLKFVSWKILSRASEMHDSEPKRRRYSKSSSDCSRAAERGKEGEWVDGWMGGEGKMELYLRDDQPIGWLFTHPLPEERHDFTISITGRGSRRRGEERVGGGE